ncbi:MAG: hypothetical protein JWO15_3744 [Sphingomonadales bacterium]|nr:hypothetical protein [Sphingomonadales bacterium]
MEPDHLLTTTTNPSRPEMGADARCACGWTSGAGTVEECRDLYALHLVEQVHDDFADQPDVEPRQVKWTADDGTIYDLVGPPSPWLPFDTVIPPRDVPKVVHAEWFPSEFAVPDYRRRPTSGGVQELALAYRDALTTLATSLIPAARTFGGVLANVHRSIGPEIRPAVRRSTARALADVGYWLAERAFHLDPESILLPDPIYDPEGTS